jgi:hypothetical protein
MAATATEHAPYTAPSIPLDLGPVRKVALGSAVVGAGLWLVLAAVNASGRDFFMTYLAAFTFWLSVPMGAFALTSIAYITSASWGLVFRRIFQASLKTIPFMGILFIPLAVSMFLPASPYWWTYEQAEIGDLLNNVKTAQVEMNHRMEMFLNIPVVLVTSLVCFVIWILVSRYILKYAPAAEDQCDRVAHGKLVAIGGPGVVLWALTTTVAITFWVMSVEIAWASTMFPVIAGVNQFLTAFAFSGLLMYTLVGGNPTALAIMKNKFRIDIGSLTYGFAMVWAYASFSQYMLIWAGNLPEEIGYYKRRLNGGWEYLAYFLMLFHWAVPFVVLLFRDVKTNPKSMKWVTTMLLIVCAADVVWWTLPTYPHEGFLHVPMVIAAIVGLGGIWGVVFLKYLGERPIFPAKDTEFLATWGHH